MADLLYARQCEMELVSRARQIRYRIVRIERMLTYWLAQPGDAQTSALVMGERRHSTLEAIRAELRAKLMEARAELAGEGRGGRAGRVPFDCGGLGCGSQPCTCQPIGEDWSEPCHCSLRGTGQCGCKWDVKL